MLEYWYVYDRDVAVGEMAERDVENSTRYKNRYFKFQASQCRGICTRCCR
jgi:hypothetical protein